MIVYQCEDSLEGIFTAIYRAYEERRDHNDTRISLDQELYLFAEYVPVVPKPEKAVKVIRTLKRQFGEEDYMRICLALSSPLPDKAQAVYQTVVKGLRSRIRPGHLFDNLADDDYNRVFVLARAAGNEEHHLRGFLRFQEVQNGILYARIGPKNNILTFLTPHFADRLPMENFVIHDHHRELFAVHPAGKEWYLLNTAGSDIDSEALMLSDAERSRQELFTYFCQKIAVKARENKKLQRNNLPLRFQEYMVEFNQNC